MKKIKITNFALAIVFVVITVICILWIIFTNNQPSTGAEILVNGKVVRRINDIGSDEEKEIVIENEYGKNVIVYGRGEIYVKEADCKNRTCVHFGSISKAGQSIICAPHKLVIKITGSDNEADAVV